jgi:hypothetical protein
MGRPNPFGGCFGGTAKKGLPRTVSSPARLASSTSTQSTASSAKLRNCESSREGEHPAARALLDGRCGGAHVASDLRSLSDLRSPSADVKPP